MDTTFSILHSLSLRVVFDMQPRWKYLEKLKVFGRFFKMSYYTF